VDPLLPVCVESPLYMAVIVSERTGVDGVALGV
jgi:hypothetical protein